MVFSNLQEVINVGVFRSQEGCIGRKLEVISEGGSLVRQPGQVVRVLDVILATGVQLLVVADLRLGQHAGLELAEPPEPGLLNAEGDLGPEELSLQLSRALETWEVIIRRGETFGIRLGL